MTEQLIPRLLAAALLFSSCTTGDEPTAIAVAAPGPTTIATRSAVDEAPKATTVAIINGRELTQAELNAFSGVYGAVPAPGRWWYDAASGMFGAEGQGAAGFMYAGHDLGPLAEDASHGDTLVFINGRRLTAAEVIYLAWLAGSTVAPGRYWVDAQLNWGSEGASDPAANLHELAAARSRSARGAADPSLWSGLVGADDSIGYVSIPGVGRI